MKLLVWGWFVCMFWVGWFVCLLWAALNMGCATGSVRSEGQLEASPILYLEACINHYQPIFTQDLKPAEEIGKNYSVSKRLPELKNLGLQGWVKIAFSTVKTRISYGQKSEIVGWSSWWSKHRECIDFTSSMKDLISGSKHLQLNVKPIRVVNA